MGEEQEPSCGGTVRFHHCVGQRAGDSIKLQGFKGLPVAATARRGDTDNTGWSAEQQPFSLCSDGDELCFFFFAAAALRQLRVAAQNGGGRRKRRRDRHIFSLNL
ncbi:hypothetical protein MHYP_G00027180 [Metynnis hypsauchen]